MRAFLVLLFFASFPAAAALQPGIWKSDTYGEILVVEGDRSTVYDVTRTTCTPREGSADYPVVEYPAPDRMVVSGNYYRYTLRRIAVLPAQCAPPTRADDARAIFDAFWETMNEHYAGFAARRIDWNAVRAEYRPRIKADMPRQELYEIVGEIVADINDPHVFLTNRKDLSFSTRDVHGVARAIRQVRPGLTNSAYHRAARAITAGIETVVRYEVLGGDFKTAFNDKLTWGMLDATVGYLRASEFMGLFTGMKREEMEPALESKLDEVFTDLGQAKALVVDVGTNTGGAAFIGVGIARRLIHEPRVAWIKRARTTEGFSDDAYSMRIEPSKSVRFNGPVVVLMSNNTLSAAEMLLMLVQGLPHVTLVGEPTPGSVTDIQMKSLPGGMTIGLPNEQLIAASGRNYDAVGVPPDVQTLVFDPRRPVSGYARTIATAQSIAHERLSR